MSTGKKDEDITKPYFSMNGIRIIIIITGLTVLSMKSYGQRISNDSVVQKIKHIEDHPFDRLFTSSTDKLMNHIRKEVETRWGDSLFILDLKRHINPSLVCVFIRGYWLGRAFVFFKDDGSEFSSKMTGVKEIIRLYRQIQKKNKVFRIKTLEIMTNYDSLQLYHLVRSLNDSASIGAIDPGLVVSPDKTASDSLYGYAPDNPIKTGTNFHEENYLYGLRGTEGQSTSFQLINTACSENFYNKVTGAYALLDEYQIKIMHTNKKVHLYFDFYHHPERKDPERMGHLLLPWGFSFKKK